MIKKMIIIAASVLVVALAAVITLTWRTKGVKEAEAKIEAIGTVNDGSLEKIVEARAFYDSLSVSEQRKVRNRELLPASEEAYDRLMAEKVDRLIAAIGKVTLESKERIDQARKAYDALTKTQKTYVLSPELIDKAEVEYENCVLDQVVEKIAAMENMTEDNIQIIDEAEEAYNALSDAQKTKVEDQLGKTFREILRQAKIRRVDILIGNIAYDKGAPSKLEYLEILTALDAYFELSVKDKADLTAQGKMDSVMAQFDKYVLSRKMTDKWYIRQEFIEDCQEASYEELLENESILGDRVALSVEITEEGKTILQTGGYGVLEGTEDLVKLDDVRLKKTPVFTEGKKYIIYGIATKAVTIKQTEEGSGLFGTNLFGKKTEEKTVPVVLVKYTDQDDVDAPDPETEELFRELQRKAADYGR